MYVCLVYDKNYDVQRVKVVFIQAVSSERS